MKKLGFGLMRLPVLDEADRKSIDYSTLNKMVDEFMAAGCTYFDTAYVYHDGMSEVAFRECVVKRYPRDSFTIATKLPTMLLRSTEQQERVFQEQLDNCGVEYFDYYLLHNLNHESMVTVDKLDSFNFARKKKAEGKIKNLGFSFHGTADMLEELLNREADMDFVQLQINYLDWNDGNIQSRLCLEVARKHNLPVIVMEPIKGGTLANVPEEAEKLMKQAEPDMSIASWAVRFTAGLDGVIVVLSGMSTPDQMEDNLSYMADFHPLNAGEREIVEKVAGIIKSSITVPCTSCRYCVDSCPKHIPIPEYFELLNAEKNCLNAGFSTQMVYYEGKVHGGSPRAGDCIACHACEKKCPQSIKIAEMMKLVSRTFDTAAG